VVGATEGSLAGTRGDFDVYIRRYNERGAEVWTRQFGTAKGDFGISVFTDDDNNTYVAGGTFGDLVRKNRGKNDAFVRKYRPNGTVIWTKQFGTSGADFQNDVTIYDDGSIYLAGNTTGSLDGSTPDGQDAYLRKYSASGAVRWTRQIDLGGTDSATSVASHGGSVYLLGTYAANNQDIFIYKYTKAGRLVWKRFVETPKPDNAPAIAVDNQGNVYIAGLTEGALRGSNQGCNDAFVRKYTPRGDVRWTRQFGGSGCDEAFGIAVRGSSELYIAGFYENSLDDKRVGRRF
jgi:hypothetical protein